MCFLAMSNFFCADMVKQRLALLTHLPGYFLLVLMSLCLSFQVPAALAHNVVSGIYADGMLIEGEIGFSNGDMAQAGSPVKVFNEAGDLLAELALLEGGVFSYVAKTSAKHIFKADLSAGHVAEMIIEADELTAPSIVASQAASTAEQKPITPTKITAATIQSTQKQATQSQNKPSDKSLAQQIMLSDDTSGGDKVGASISVEQLQSIVRSAVAQQIRPLQKELRAYKEKVMFRDVAGGLGFIFGLFGVAAWMASRRNQGDNNASVP